MSRDPRERRTGDGMIATGASSERVAPEFRSAIDDIVDSFDRSEVGAALYLYGSVATGQARVGTSDIDLLVIDGAPERIGALVKDASARFSDLTRGVEVAAADATDITDRSDEAYGFRVFLRHYCVHLAGRTTDRPTADFPADAKAARGFNGDIAAHLERWWHELERVDGERNVSDLARRVARKTLLAVAGLVSVHDRTWTTDRVGAAERWAAVEPSTASGLDVLLAWSTGVEAVAVRDVSGALHEVVDPVVSRFEEDIGLWPG